MKEINVVTLITDNQDGGFSADVYNNNEEMLADHSALKFLDDEADPEQIKKDILSGADEYTYGYLGKATIKINDDGTIVPFFFHGGQ